MLRCCAAGAAGWWWLALRWVVGGAKRLFSLSSFSPGPKLGLTLRSCASQPKGFSLERLLPVAAHRALAGTLLELPVNEAGCNGEAPWLEDVLHEARLQDPPGPSRLPASTV